MDIHRDSPSLSNPFWNQERRNFLPPSFFLSLFLSVHSFFGSKRNITIVKKLGWWCLDVKVDEASSRYTTFSLSLSLFLYYSFRHPLIFFHFKFFSPLFWTERMREKKEREKERRKRELMWNLKTKNSILMYFISLRFETWNRTKSSPKNSNRLILRFFSHILLFSPLPLVF